MTIEPKQRGTGRHPLAGPGRHRLVPRAADPRPRVADLRDMQRGDLQTDDLLPGDVPPRDVSPGDVPPGDVPPGDLRQQTTAGIGWAGLSRVAIQIVQFASTVAMARLLLPGEVGLAALVTAIVQFANLFSDLGLGAALIHRQDDADERFRSTAFWLNALTGLALTVLFAACSVPLAHLFGKAELAPLIVAGSFIFGLSMYAVQLALLEKAMRYKAVGLIEFLAAIVSLTVAVISALAGAGAMSIVLGSLAQAVTTTVGMWTIVRWRPHHFMDRSSLRRIWSYSGNVFGFNVVTYWARNLDDLLIGRYGTAADLGYYSRAYMVMLMPVQQVVMVIGRVLFPALSRLQHDHDRLRRAYVRALALMIAVAAPLSLGLAAGAGPFIDVAYGHRWHPAAQLLTILALSGPAQLIAGTSGSLFQAIGRTGAQLRRGLINAVVTVVAIVIGLQWGATGVAVALLIKYYALMPQTVRLCWREIGLTLPAGLRAVAPPVLASVVMAAVMYALGLTLNLSALPLLLVEATVGLVLYLVVFRFLGRALLLDLIDVAVPRRFVPARLLAATRG